MKPPSSIPFLRTANGEVLADNPLSRAVLSSARTNWHNLVVEEHHIRSCDLDEVMFIQHVVAVSVGRPVACEFKKDGRLRHVVKTGTISFFPSNRPFFSRMRQNEGGSLAALFVGLDPVFVNQTAEALEVYPDRVDLLEQRGGTDPVLRHIAMALRAGLQTGRGDDPMYADALSTALAVHLLREYGGMAVGRQDPHGGLSKEKLNRAIEYIQDQLETDLTVSDVAGAVHISPFHFTRLFKQSTGQSPYSYVIQARVQKAKELLISGKFSIVEIAHRLGFADQSHLTRHVKHLLGVTPKMLQQRRCREQDSSKDPQEHPRKRPA